MRFARAFLALMLVAGCETSSEQPQNSVSAGSGLAAFGKLTWKSKFDAAALVRDGRATFAVRSNGVAAVAGDGSVASQQEFPAKVTSPMTVVSDAFYGSGKSLVSVTFPEGEERWTAKTSSRVGAAPTVAGRRVVVAAGDLTGFDAGSGDELWAVDGGFSGRVAARDGAVFAASKGGDIVSIDAANGQSNWKLETSSDFAGAGVSLNSQLALVADRDGVVWAVFAESGRERWRFDTRSVISTDLAVRDHTAWVGSEAGELIALNTQTGQLRWKIDELPALVTTPVFAGGRIYVGGDDGSMTVVNAETGEAVWSYELEAEPAVPPLVDDGKVWFVDVKGQVYLVE